MNQLPEILATAEFAPIDRQFASFLNSIAAQPCAELALAAALVSRSRGDGDVCLDLHRIAGQMFESGINTRRREAGPKANAPAEQVVTTRLPDFAPWCVTLRASGVVGAPGEFTPLVLDAAGRLYLHRYWSYETRLAETLRRLSTDEAPMADTTAIRAALERRFPSGASVDLDQRLAAETALTRVFTVITGGPGTGKTRTIAQILELMTGLPSARPLRIALAAPTGKAAARMEESIARLRDTGLVPRPAETRAPEVKAVTLHRLLGVRPGVAEPRFHHGNPLPFDIVVIDEASMVDLALMAKLFDALAPGTRLLLAGDKDQLASVDAGAVLGDICHGLCRVTDAPLRQCLVPLRTMHRFKDGRALESLRRAVHDGNDPAALVLAPESTADSSLRVNDPPAPEMIETVLRERILDWFQAITTAADPAAALAALARFRILCALRVGPHGSEALNRHAESLLAREGFLRAGQSQYPGRPLLVTRNDPALGLSNGDLGVLLPGPDGGSLRAWFATGGGEPRSILPARLPEHETTFAMTVHKAQGSEFEEVLLVLPNRWNAILTRELLYTGITRARERMELWARPELLQRAARNLSVRTSGLRDQLWGRETDLSRS